jgi:hypothetical protein
MAAQPASLTMNDAVTSSISCTQQRTVPMTDQPLMHSLHKTDPELFDPKELAMILESSDFSFDSDQMDIGDVIGTPQCTSTPQNVLGRGKTFHCCTCGMHIKGYSSFKRHRDKHYEVAGPSRGTVKRSHSYSNCDDYDGPLQK